MSKAVVCKFAPYTKTKIHNNRKGHTKFAGSAASRSKLQGPTVDQEIFTLKIIRVKNFRVVKFSRFRSIREFFLTVDDCNVDKRLRLVYYQVSGEPGITRCSRRSDIYLGKCGLARTSLFTDHRCVILFFTCLIFTVGLDRKIILTAKFSWSTVKENANLLLNHLKDSGPLYCNCL